MRKTVLIHPGFHKTGTTTMQRGLWCRRRALEDQLDMVILKDVRPLSLCARAYSTEPSLGKLFNLAGALAKTLARKDRTDTRPLLISSEALVGQIPGRNGFQSYAHAPVLLEKMIQVIHGHYGPQLDVMVWFTTRDPESWRKSVYFQNVKTVRLTEDYATFKAKLNDAPGLDEIVHRTQTRLAGQARVLSSRLEIARQRRLGLMGEMFDILGIDWWDATPPIQQNVQDDDLMEALLKINRSALCDEDVSAAKAEVLAWHRKRCQQLAITHSSDLRPEIQGPWALASRSPGHWSDGPYR